MNQKEVFSACKDFYFMYYFIETILQEKKDFSVRYFFSLKGYLARENWQEGKLFSRYCVTTFFLSNMGKCYHAAPTA